MGKEYVVTHRAPDSAEILEGNRKRGTLRKTDKVGVFELEALDDDDKAKKWTLSSKVDGEIRPFSIVCYSEDEPEKGDSTLRIKDHIFSHDHNFYSVGEVLPIGIPKEESPIGPKRICRLVNFPFSGLDNVDKETLNRLRRYRGVPVAEILGRGAEGYHLKIYGEELSDIGLQLTASTYLLYTTR